MRVQTELYDANFVHVFNNVMYSLKSVALAKSSIFALKPKEWMNEMGTDWNPKIFQKLFNLLDAFLQIDFEMGEGRTVCHYRFQFEKVIRITIAYASV